MTVREWTRPPVIEVAVGVQFDSLRGLTNADLAEIWRTRFRDRYPQVADAPASEEPPELFLNDASVRVPMFGVGVVSGASRLRAVTDSKLEADARMIQLQNGWIVANWMHRKGRTYPGFSGVRDEFVRVLDAVREYTDASGLGPIVPRMWEVAYIDHVPAGSLWRTDDELPTVFPGLLGHGRAENASAQHGQAMWQWRFDRPRRANLRVTLTVHPRLGQPPVQTAVVETLARGPVDPTDRSSVAGGVEFGREIAVRTFTGLCSERALAYWRGVD